MSLEYARYLPSTYTSNEPLQVERGRGRGCKRVVSLSTAHAQARFDARGSSQRGTHEEPNSRVIFRLSMRAWRERACCMTLRAGGSRGRRGDGVHVAAAGRVNRRQAGVRTAPSTMAASCVIDVLRTCYSNLRAKTGAKVVRVTRAP